MLQLFAYFLSVSQLLFLVSVTLEQLFRSRGFFFYGSNVGCELSQHAVDTQTSFVLWCNINTSNAVRRPNKSPAGCCDSRGDYVPISCLTIMASVSRQRSPSMATALVTFWHVFRR